MIKKPEKHQFLTFEAKKDGGKAPTISTRDAKFDCRPPNYQNHGMRMRDLLNTVKKIKNRTLASTAAVRKTVRWNKPAATYYIITKIRVDPRFTFILFKIFVDLRICSFKCAPHSGTRLKKLKTHIM